MPEVRGPADRAESLLGLIGRAASDLAGGPAAVALPNGPEGDATRVLIRQEAEHLFLFVVLSVLLENRPGQDPRDKEVAALIKKELARRILDAKRQAKELAKKSLRTEQARRFNARLDEAGTEDPFTPYYDSFKNAVRDPSQTPFAIFARRVTEKHLPPARRLSAHQRLLSLSVLLADELLDSIPR